jgi:hypothetical protein
MKDGGDIANSNKTPGLLGGGNVLFNNPWTFLPSGTTAGRPAPSIATNYRLRFNTDDKLYEYYDAISAEWVQIQNNDFNAGPFVTYTADTDLPGAQNLGILANGILKQTITTGVATLNIAVNGTDYYGPGFIVPGVSGGTGVNNSGQTIDLTSFGKGYALISDINGNARWRLVSEAGAVTTITGDSGTINPDVGGIIIITGSPTGLTFTGSGNTLTLGGILVPANGGLGTSTAPTAGKIPIGTSGNIYTPAAINSGTNILVGNASGSITISITGIISGTNGGTGVNNGASLFTIGGNTTFSGAFTFTGTITGNTTVTFPTSGTLATVGGTVTSIQGTANQVLVNGTSGSPVAGTAIILTTPQDIAVTSSPTFAALTLTAPLTGANGGTGVSNSGKTITIGGNVTYSGAFAFTGTLTNTTNVTFPTSGTLVNTAVTTLSSLASIGTITTGVWNGTVIAGQYGGTGVANTGSTITVGGNTAFSGAFTFTGTVTGNTAVTFPTSGTLVNTAVTTLSSLVSIGTITTGTWNATVITGQYGGTGVANTGLTISLASGGTGKVLSSDVSGNATWAALSGLGVTSITGTANQIIASAATGAVTLSAPQNLDTAATFQVGTLGVGVVNSSFSMATILGTNAFLMQALGTQVSTATQASVLSIGGILLNGSLQPTSGAAKAFGFDVNQGVYVPNAQTITVYSCFLADPVFTSNIGTITTAYGFNFTGGTTEGGTITTGYGARIAKPLFGTTKITARLEGRTQIGTSQQFDVSDSGVVTAGVWQGTVIDGTYINYNTTNFKVTASQLNTIQNINTTAVFQIGTLGIGAAVSSAPLTSSMYLSQATAFGFITGGTVTATVDVGGGLQGATVIDLLTTFQPTVATDRVSGLGSVYTVDTTNATINVAYGVFARPQKTGANALTSIYGGYFPQVSGAVTNNLALYAYDFKAGSSNQFSVTSAGAVTAASLALTTPLALTSGGTNASLTASNGGIFYSTASAGAILSGTATASQILLSGASAAPTWSTATYPSVVAVNQIMYGSSSNVFGLIATNNSSILGTSAGGIPSMMATLPSSVQTNITNLGTITFGVWNGTLVGVTYGGTGTATNFTAGSVVYAGTSGVYNQDNANFFWDATNHFLGLGTTSPGGKVDIRFSETGTTPFSGNSTQVRLQNTSNTTNNYASIGFFGQSGTVAGAMGMQFTDQTNAYGDLAFITRSAATGITEKMRITGGGLIGMGTAAPLYQLDIRNTSATTCNMSIGKWTGAPPTAYGTPYLKIGGAEFGASGLYTIGFAFQSAVADKPGVEIGAAVVTSSGARGIFDFVVATSSTNSLSSAAIERFRITNDGFVQLAAPSFTANATTATIVTSLGPAGANTTIQEWLTIKNAAGTTRYIPCF